MKFLFGAVIVLSLFASEALSNPTGNGNAGNAVGNGNAGNAAGNGNAGNAAGNGNADNAAGNGNVGNTSENTDNNSNGGNGNSGNNTGSVNNSNLPRPWLNDIDADMSDDDVIREPWRGTCFTDGYTMWVYNAIGPSFTFNDHPPSAIRLNDDLCIAGLTRLGVLDSNGVRIR